MDLFNQGPAGLCVVLPLTTKKKDILWHVSVAPAESGLKLAGYIKCEDIRSISLERVSRRLGSVSASVLYAVEYRIVRLLGIRPCAPTA